MGLTRRILSVGIGAVALASIVAGCGGGAASSATSASSTTTTPASRGSSAQASFQKYTQCLTSHGVPTGAAGSLFGGRRPGGAAPGSGSGTSTPPSSRPAGTRPTIPAQYQAAFQACSSLRPTGGFGGFGGGLNSAQLAAYRNCLQIHGVKLPTPTTTTPGQTTPRSGSGGFGRGGFGNLTNNPTYQAAAKACAALLPARTGSSTTTTVPASS